MTSVRSAGSQPLAGLLVGASTMVDLLVRTLGPSSGLLLSAVGRGSFEALEDSAAVAHRITQLPGRANTGAMLVREMALAVQRRNGDGVATAAALTQPMLTGGARAVAAGANPVQVRHGIERGVAAGVAALDADAEPIDGHDELARLAIGATGDPELGELLGEMFDVLGERASIVLAKRVTPGLDREYLEGARWTARPAYRGLLPEGKARMTVRDPFVVAVDQTLVGADVVAAAEVGHATRHAVVLVARDVSEEASQLLARHHHAVRGGLVAAVVLGSAERRRSADLEDLSLLAGGVVLSDEIGRPPGSLREEQCGRARHLVLSRRQVDVVGGAGDSARVAQRVGELNAQAATVPRGDAEWSKLRARMARLSGAVGVLVVGARSNHEHELTAQRVAKAQRVLELATMGGVVAGGGVAYLQSAARVAATRELCRSADERWGVDVVARALAEPFRRLVTNHAGISPVSPDAALNRVRELGDGWGVDVSAGTYVLMRKAGIVDCLGVASGALAAAGSLAATIVTTGARVPARTQASRG